jgi:uroporphyrinogen III methyltransferase/synthase
VVEAPLAQLAARVAAAGLGAPATIVVGDVVRLRATLAWTERLPLFGWRVLVTRAEEQAGPFARALRAAGADPVRIPLIRIEAVRALGDLDQALARLHTYDALVFASANAVRIVAERAAERGIALGAAPSPRVFCVGPATAEAAQAAGFRVEAVPERHDAEGLLALLRATFPPSGRAFLLPGAARPRETLVQGLVEAGGTVQAIPIYRTRAADVDAAGLRQRLTLGALDALTFASPSTVTHFVAILDADARREAERCVIAAIGKTTAEALREAGLPPSVVAESADPESLVAALVRAAAAREGVQGAGGAR